MSKIIVGKTITTSECENCIHSKIDESDKAKVYVLCNARNKKYLYGQRIPCEDFERKKE